MVTVHDDVTPSLRCLVQRLRELRFPRYERPRKHLKLHACLTLMQNISSWARNASDASGMFDGHKQKTGSDPVGDTNSASHRKKTRETSMCRKSAACAAVRNSTYSAGSSDDILHRNVRPQAGRPRGRAHWLELTVFLYFHNL